MWSPSLLGNLSCPVQLVGIALDASRNVCLGARCTFLVPRRMVPPWYVVFPGKGWLDMTRLVILCCQRTFRCSAASAAQRCKLRLDRNATTRRRIRMCQFAVHDLFAWMTGAASAKDPKLPLQCVENSRSGFNGSIHVTLDVWSVSYRLCGLQ